jgi:hypothetical protein
MNGTQKFNHSMQLSLLVLFAALALASTASAATSSEEFFMPGKLCGHVSGASWKFQGQSGTQYNVSAMPARSCAVAMKSVSALTKQKPRASGFITHALAGPSGFHCAGSGIVNPASAGFCGGKNGASFYWAPRLKN